GRLAEAEATRPAPDHAAAVALRGHAGVPLVGAIAQRVDAAQVDELLEAELVAQHLAARLPRSSLEDDANLGAPASHRDRGVAEAFAQALGKCLVPLSHHAAPCGSRRSCWRDGSCAAAAG